MKNSATVFLLALAVLGCSEENPFSTTSDAATTADTSVVGDSGTSADGAADATAPDAATPDAATPDAATPDATTPDAALVDASDSGLGSDACAPDSGKCLLKEGWCFDDTDCEQSEYCKGTCDDIGACAPRKRGCTIEKTTYCTCEGKRVTQGTDCINERYNPGDESCF